MWNIWPFPKPRRLSRTESRTAVLSMAALGCRWETDLGRKKIAELGPPWSKTLCEIQQEGEDVCSRAPPGAQQGEKDRKKSTKALCQISLQPKTASSPACAQAVPSSSGGSKAVPGKSTCTHYPHLAPSKMQG